MAGQVTANKLAELAQFGDAFTKAKILVIDSAAGSGGAASEAMTFTGLKSTDTILSVSQIVAGANDLAITEVSTQIDDGLTVAYTADPGEGSVVRIVVARG